MNSSKWHLGFMAFSTYFRIASQLLIFVLLARILGAEQYGVISYWLSVTTLIAIPINYGFGTQILREAAHSPESLPALLSGMLRAKIWLSLLIGGLLLLGTLIFPVPAVFWVLLLLSWADSFSEFYNFALRSRGQFAFEARLALATSLLQFSVLAVALWSREVLPVALAYLCCRGVALVITWRGARSTLGLERGAVGNPAPLFKTLASGLPYAADVAMSTLNNAVDIVILKQLTDLRTVGIYQAGSRLMLGGTTPATVLSNVYLPRVSALDSGGKEYASAIAGMNLKMLLAGGAVSLALALGNELITDLLFGPGYRELAQLLPWFALVLVLRYVAASFGINLTASGHQSVRVLANLGYLATFLGAAFLLVPRYQAVGLLAASACATLALALTYSGYVLARRLPSGIDLGNAGIFVAMIAVICGRIAGGL